jgi:uncharacterized membrane protein
MKRIEKLLKYITASLGLISLLFFTAGYFLFEMIRPKMIQFEKITSSEEGLVTYFGIGLLIFLIFCLLSFYRIVRYLKSTKKITFSYLLLIAICVLSFLSVFGDITLMDDIFTQYKFGMSQPEWSILYIVMAFQFVSGAFLIYINLFKSIKESEAKYIARDSNIFIIAQYIGTICGILGLSGTIVRSLFHTPLWMTKIHTTISILILLIPYVLIVIYWFIVKTREKTKEWYDEKQIQDIGRSSSLTLIISLVAMSLLYFLNYNNLDSEVSIMWLPFYVFLVLFLFSLCNLCFSLKEYS